MNAKTDIWMPLVIGDYLKDTQHLLAEEHGCYLLWLMHYWVRGPLPSSIDKLIAIGKLTGTDAPSIAQALLNEYFKLESDGLYHQGRADKEKERWQGKRLQAKDKAEKAAAARWKKDASSNAQSNASSTPQAMLELCPSSSPSPLPKKLKTNTTLFVLPDWVPREQWDAWMPVRKAKRATNSASALEIAVKRLAELKLEGFNPAEVLEQSILRGYTGLFPLQRNGKHGGSNGKQQSALSQFVEENRVGPDGHIDLERIKTGSPYFDELLEAIDEGT